MKAHVEEKPKKTGWTGLRIKEQDEIKAILDSICSSFNLLHIAGFPSDLFFVYRCVFVLLLDLFSTLCLQQGLPNILSVELGWAYHTRLCEWLSPYLELYVAYVVILIWSDWDVCNPLQPLQSLSCFLTLCHRLWSERAQWFGGTGSGTGKMPFLASFVKLYVLSMKHK